jgi:phosphinothricin acetyltransferase
VNDHELLRAFEECSLPHDQWTHRCHVKIAYLYLRRFPYEQALVRIRHGIQKYNVAQSVVEGPTSGYNETMTQAFTRLIAATIDAHEPVMPTSTADEFCDAHPQLMTSHVLRLFYSPAIRSNTAAKTQFVEPDLATLPLPNAFVHRREAMLGAFDTLSADDILIRLATQTDVPAITAIYNEAVLTTTATFDTEPKTVEERRRWFENHDERHPVIVALADGQVVGWSAISRWSERKAYEETGETSFYVRFDFRGRGIGRRLKEATIDEARRLGFHTLIARVAEGSDASLHLNESCGFIRVGTMREVGRKFGRLLDVHILQKMLDCGPQRGEADPDDSHSAKRVGPRRG